MKRNEVKQSEAIDKTDNRSKAPPLFAPSESHGELQLPSGDLIATT